jgi:hypothetical protein
MQSAPASLFVWLILAFTLGLAPFDPEPHVIEKIKWVLSGAEGMRFIDWFDLLMHGTPWVMLVVTLVKWLKQGKTTPKA